MNFENTVPATLDQRAKACLLNFIVVSLPAGLLSQWLNDMRVYPLFVLLAIVIFGILKWSPGSSAMNIFVIRNNQSAPTSARLLRNFFNLSYVVSIFIFTALVGAVGSQSNLWKEILLICITLISATFIFVGYFNFKEMYDDAERISWLDKYLKVRVVALPKPNEIRTSRWW